jgi:hypothetical protein
VIDCRRIDYADNDFFRMTRFWEDLVDEQGYWTIRKYRSGGGDDYLRRAQVTVFDDRATLTVDETLWSKAERGEKLANHVLAHEAGHLALDHHAKGKGRGRLVQNFRLTEGAAGMELHALTQEDLEADLAAVFLQCGVALENLKMSAIELANRACADIRQVNKAQSYVRLDVFQRELHRPRPQHPRVVL